MESLFNPANFRDLGALTVVTFGVVAIIVLGLLPMVKLLFGFLSESRRLQHTEEAARIESDKNQTKALEALNKTLLDQSRLYEQQSSVTTELAETVKELKNQMLKAGLDMQARAQQRDKRLDAIEAKLDKVPQEVQAALNEPLLAHTNGLELVRTEVKAVNKTGTELASVLTILQSLVPQLKTELINRVGNEEKARLVCAEFMSKIAVRLSEIEQILKIPPTETENGEPTNA